MSKILEYLNIEQQQAVTYKGKYLQINAGPGTGKTTTLAAKILYTQSELGADTDKILGISFSRSAKSQLLNKLEEFSDQVGFGGKPAILTFHSLAHRIIKYGIHCSESRFRSGFQRINTEDFLSLEPSLLKGLCIDYADRTVVNKVLSQAYNLIRQGNWFQSNPIEYYDDIDLSKPYPVTTYEYGRILIKGNDLKKFWKRISKIEKLKNVTDFQGMITEAIRLLQLRNQTYNAVSSQYHYIFVDEYQDTSIAQEKLLLSMIDTSHSVTVVGDKNQTIYTFNGSNSENLNRFNEHFSKVDRKSVKQIDLIQNYRSTGEVITLANDFIREKNIVSYDARTGFKPAVVETHSIDLAASYVSNTIKELVDNGEYAPSDICILYRKNSAYSPQGDKVIEHLENLNIAYTRKHPQNQKSRSLTALVTDLENEYEDEPLDEVVAKLMEKDADKTVLIFVKDAMSQGAVEVDDLMDYAIELEEEVPDMEDKGVILKTVHDAKGLEYPVVFILYLGDREFPHSSQPDIDEEIRLFYVGLTRAQNRLYIVGEKGIHQESFLDNCLHSNVEHIHYHSSRFEEKNDGFTSRDKNLINETTKQLKDAEEKEQQGLKDLMDLF
ncbi:ATP-dependent helicase [Virgibacillus senegalensis]|uniref:ATP-dependent helicase n=1 Tax=Virgibacillus senegalensis TaxID=1499679 RepID=UPI00069F00B9|nr:ATP-dependent helicase [Virgibacillus senegalensis]